MWLDRLQCMRNGASDVANSHLFLTSSMRDVEV
jgi:hypothetical protein